MAEYRIVLHKHEHGAVGDYLSSHGSIDSDSRSGDSTHVHVNVEDFGDRWVLEPVEGKPCTFQIRLANPGNGAVGSYLSAHRTVDGDARSGDSTYVNINENDCHDEWTLEAILCEGTSHFRIHLAKSEYGAVGTVLSVHKTVSGDVISDERGEDSTYVHVNESPSESHWVLEQV